LSAPRATPQQRARTIKPLRRLLALGPIVAVLLVTAPGHASPGRHVSEWKDRTMAAAPSALAPSAGEDCAAIYYPSHHSLVVYGGKGDDDKNRNELWEYSLDRNDWQAIPVDGAAPTPTEDHSLVYDPVGDRLILYGGEDGPTGNQLWSFSFASHAWKSLGDSTTPPREDHTAVYDSRRRRMVTFGGWAGDDHNYYDVRALDLDPGSATFQKWLDLTVETKHPWGRSDHAAVYDSVRDRMLIFGGWDKDQKTYLDDTWSFTMPASPESAGTWRQIKTKRSHPPRRRHAIAVYDSRRDWFLISGGQGDEGYLNDVWAFDLSHDVWINVTPGPQPRIDHQAVFDPQTGRMIIYGGDAHIGAKFHDLWELEIDPNAPIDRMIIDSSAKPKAH
jgi:hypothetical protein